MTDITDFGIKVALPGFDVKTATPEQCAMHSSYPHLKIQRPTGGVNFWNTLSYVFASEPGASSTTAILSVAHNYGYKPANMGFVYANTGVGATFPIDTYLTLPASLGTGAGTVGGAFSCYADDTTFNIVFKALSGGTGVTMLNSSWTFKYYIFAENGA